jgi:hypothetical protein
MHVPMCCKPGKGKRDLTRLGSESGISTYLFGILSQRVVHLDRFLDHSLVGDLEEREADNLWHFGGLSFSVRKTDSLRIFESTFRAPYKEVYISENLGTCYKVLLVVGAPE